MKKYLAIAVVSMSSLLFTGCNKEKIDDVVSVLSYLAPEGKDNAVDGYRNLTVKNVGKWQVHFIGLYKEEGVVYARSFDIEGMWSRYEGAPFAWKIPAGQ